VFHRVNEEIKESIQLPPSLLAVISYKVHDLSVEGLKHLMARILSCCSEVRAAQLFEDSGKGVLEDLRSHRSNFRLGVIDQNFEEVALIFSHLLFRSEDTVVKEVHKAVGVLGGQTEDLVSH
jgi:hypothetical protein